ncbi:hypothetical protein GXW83_04075 [Streptacidiphilus sp. PB12-B1b]|uniref:hypothetical protein n=1 Tax=Streptacidiphilus sp. PB12-B1b TaxID=2705012 RepID=UPI0015F93792|nr:hypothetical protein [Streptacidiphilus sp. PB12-B1b]QMU75062.1 hypothetical protein GXW83_04075 [Streptacidiphilus sp. PB12-B1b]
MHVAGEDVLGDGRRAPVAEPVGAQQQVPGGRRGAVTGPGRQRGGNQRPFRAELLLAQVEPPAR